MLSHHSAYGLDPMFFLLAFPEVISSSHMELEASGDVLMTGASLGGGASCYVCSCTKHHIQKGPELSLMLCCCCVESLSTFIFELLLFNRSLLRQWNMCGSEGDAHNMCIYQSPSLALATKLAFTVPGEHRTLGGPQYKGIQ